MNRKALFLSSVMLRGHGVSVVAHEIAKRVEHHGWQLIIGCLEVDDDFSNPSVVTLPSDPVVIREFCAAYEIDVVVAQTSPYFEVLPALAGTVATVVYEHGDPTPSFFIRDSAEREAIRRNKIAVVYPNVSLVAASSHFLAHDIEWPSARVCTLGADHVNIESREDSRKAITSSSEPLRVGTLMRLGSGEAQYKGNTLFVDLVKKLRQRHVVQPCVMGRGTADDKRFWEEQGFEIHLNASDNERAEYLRGLDVFVSSSQWEGFNLPLVEAQAMGTVAIAYEVGAHPETTPLVMAHVDDAAAFIAALDGERSQLIALGEKCHDFVLKKFTWSSTAEEFAKLLDEAVQVGPVAAVGSPSTPTIAKRLVGLIKREGVGGAGRIIVGRLIRRTGRR